MFAEKEKETHNKIFNSVQSKSILSPFMHNNAKTSSAIHSYWCFYGSFVLPSQYKNGKQNNVWFEQKQMSIKNRVEHTDA